MPGVNVTTATRSGPVAQNVAPSGRFFASGLAARGRTTKPIQVSSILDFEAEFGTRQSYSHLYDNIATFFEEGGSEAHVVRVVGPAATKGTITLVDRAGSPLNTIKFDAISAGAWSGDLDIVTTNGTVSNTFTIAVVLDGETVEIHRNIPSPADAVVAFEDSIYVVCTNLGSATVAPNNNPAVATSNMSAGTDDRASVDAGDYETSLELFIPGLGDGAVAIPGIGSTVHDALVAHAAANNRIALLSDSETADIAALIASAGALDSEYAGLFAPWVQISTNTGARYTSPEGYVAGVRNRAHTESGPWRAPAGEIAVAKSVVGLKFDYTRAEGDELDAGKVSAIRIRNNSIRLYGWRSLSEDVDNWAMLIGRDTLNSIVVSAETVLEQYVFQPVDSKGHLLSSINGALVGILEPMARAGGLYPRFDSLNNIIDPGFLVDTGNTVNSIENLANNEVKARVSVRIAPTAALISVTIIKVGLLSGL